MHHDRLQQFVVIDYSKEMVVLAVVEKDSEEMIVGMGQYNVDEATLSGEVAFVVRDDYQRQGIATELLVYLTYLARRNGLHGFMAEVLMENKAMLSIFKKAGFVVEKAESGDYVLYLSFKES